MQRTARITKTFRFEAAHHLPNHAGKCARLHGHSYAADISVTGPVHEVDGTSEEGMVIDFARLDDAWAALKNVLDHHDLNETLPSSYQPPTAEHIACFIRDEIIDAFVISDLNVEVMLWETPMSRVTVPGPSQS